MSPAARMDITMITEAALNVLDSKGFPALSMRTVAAELGVKAGSLYYHVRNRHDLLRLVAESVVGQVFAAVEPGRGWRVLLTDLATALRARLRDHPGAAQVVAVTEVSAECYQPLIPAVVTAFTSELSIEEPDVLHLTQSLYVLVTGLALAEFGNAPEPPTAGRGYYDAWFDLAVGVFIDGIGARFQEAE